MTVPYKTKAVNKFGFDVEIIDGDTLVVPDWFARNKYFYESKKHRRKYEKFDSRVLAVVGETEKAYNVILGHTKRLVPCWVAKRFVTIDEVPNDGDFTMITDYATAMKVAYLLRTDSEKKTTTITTEETEQCQQQ